MDSFALKALKTFDCKGCAWAEAKECIKRMAENALTIIQAEPAEENHDA